MESAVSNKFSSACVLRCVGELMPRSVRVPYVEAAPISIILLGFGSPDFAVDAGLANDLGFTVTLIVAFLSDGVVVRTLLVELGAGGVVGRVRSLSRYLQSRDYF